jgi:hypothetical protein
LNGAKLNRESESGEILGGETHAYNSFKPMPQSGSV